jgi:enoyl-CoA hydratase
MDLILTGRLIDAQEAKACGLVARVVPPEELLSVALDAADKIASYSYPAVLLAKEAVNRAEEVSLSEGCDMSAACFRPLSPQVVRKKGWLRSWRSVKPYFRAAKALARKYP